MIVISILDNKPKDLKQEIDYKLSVTKKNENICIDGNTNGEHTSTLVNEGFTYYIIHNQKEYYCFDSNEADLEVDILKDELAGINGKKCKTGHEKINGKDYYYEEYDGISAFAVTLSYNEESNAKARFYFDEKNIAYIKNIINGETELLKVEFSDIINEDVFNIPSDYAEK